MPPPKWSSTRDSALRKFALDCGGGCLCVLVLLYLLSWFLVAFPVNTISDMPVWARSIAYLSTAHELGDIYDNRALPPSAPPFF